MGCNGWQWLETERAGGVNGADIAAVLQQKTQAPAYVHLFFSGLLGRDCIIRLHGACIKQAFFWFSLGFD